MQINEITGGIIESAIKVHKSLGRDCSNQPMKPAWHMTAQARISCEVQKIIPIDYDGLKLDAGYRIDLLVESRVIVELKAVEKVNPIFEAQLLSYLRLST